MGKHPQIFLSYSSIDKDIARRLADDLREEGINVWYDEFEIKIGDSIRRKIDEGIKKSDFILALLSKNSVNSRWVREELDTAFAKNAEGAKSVIIPVLTEDIDVSEIPLFLRSIRWLDLSKDYKTGLTTLIKAITGAPKVQERPATPSDLIDVGDLAKEVAKEVMEVLKTNSQGIRVPDYDPDPNLVFVIMSFTEDMEPIFEGVKAAGENHNLKVERVKDVPGDYRITDKIVEMIHRARIIVADLTHERPNVYFELGYVRGLGKTVITTARDETKIHFDVKDWTCKFYSDSRIIERYLDERFAYELGKS